MEHDRTTPQSKSTTAPAQPAMTGDDDLLALRAADRYFDFLAAGQTPTGRDDVKGSKKAPHSTPPSERTPSTSVEGKNTDDTSASESTKVSDAESAEDDSSVTEKSTSVTDNPTGSSSSEKSSAGSAHSSHVQSPHPPTVPPLDEPLSLLISLR